VTAPRRLRLGLSPGGSRRRGEPAGVRLRARTSVLVGVALLALVGVLLADALVRGRWDVAVLSLPALGLVAFFAVEVFLRPSIRVHPGGITVVNPLVTTEVPWADVGDVTTRFLVTVHARNGRRIHCWGAPTAARTAPTTTRSTVSSASETSAWLRASSPHRVIESYVVQYGDLPASTGGVEHAAGAHRHWHSMTVFLALALVLVAAGQVAIGG